MDDLQNLIARAAISDVKARYCHCIDTKDWVGYGALFTDDAVMDVSEEGAIPIAYGRDAILKLVAWSVTGARSAHQVHNLEVTFDGPDAADVIWAMQDRLIWAADSSPIAPATTLTGYGHYVERYVRTDGEWRIAKLKLTRLIVETA